MLARLWEYQWIFSISIFPLAPRYRSWIWAHVLLRLTGSEIVTFCFALGGLVSVWDGGILYFFMRAREEKDTSYIGIKNL